MSAPASCASSSVTSQRPAGYVLPVQRWTARASPGWISELWQLRRGRLFLLPGDSADRLSPAAEFAALSQRRPTSLVSCLPIRLRIAARCADPSVMLRTFAGDGFAAPPLAAGHASAAPGARRTGQDAAAGAHRAHGRTARWSALRVHAAGRTAGGLSRTRWRRSRRPRRELNLPIHVEGYPPPPDPRLNVIKVTPDPGVIEVNIHPSSSWREAVDVTRTLYEEARLCRLGADKFMIDGRHTGTGGGNHVVLGGQAAADSPFLRRPDLLKSLILYFQRHPSLSYLFSGLFIGPTSQAPRVDEARHDLLYELEIALGMVPAPGAVSSRGRGWSTACSATCWSTLPATRTARRSASTSCTLRMARPAGSAWSSSARSKCRRTRA